MTFSNPKEYWKILNSGRKQHRADIPINIFLDYFKTLNLRNPTEEETNIENQNDIERLNIVLNSSITADVFSLNIFHLHKSYPYVLNILFHLIFLYI
jgi:hypothetical protein